MNLKLKNFGKIAEADVRLDGITVICGNNNSGKSTIGKALFGIFNSLCDYKQKIIENKAEALIRFTRRSEGHFVSFRMRREKIEQFIVEHNGEYTIEEVTEFLNDNFSVKASDDNISDLLTFLNTPDADALDALVLSYFGSLMNRQIKNAKARSNGACSVECKFRKGSDIIKFSDGKASCTIKESIQHCAYYINSPFVLDNLNNFRSYNNTLNLMERSVITAILEAVNKADEDPTKDFLGSAVNAKELEEIRGVLKNTYPGSLIRKDGLYYYNDNGIDIDIRNISAGLKAFGLIERMLETGVLKKKDILILDEPEIHLHSEWQIKYAELIVALQKKFDLTILIVTHSFQFLESLEFFMKVHGISDKGNYYLPEETDKGTVMRSCTNNLRKLKQGLKSGMYTLADLQLDEINDGDSDEEDNE